MRGFFLIWISPSRKHTKTLEDEDDVQSRTPEEKGGWDSTRKVDMVVRVVQPNKVMFLPFWFCILKCIWWINNTRESCCLLGGTTPVRWQTVVVRHKQADRHKYFRPKHADTWLWDVFVFLHFLNKSFVAETLLQTFISQMRMINEVSWVFLLQLSELLCTTL